MKKSVVIAAVFALLTIGTNVSADTVLPGAHVPVDQSVMGVGKTMMEMGAADRAATSRLNQASRKIMSAPGATVNLSYQFGSSQSDQSWKQARTVEEAQVRGLVPGDCQGDNSTDWYRKAMGQSREGFMKETLVPNDICGDYHPTLK